jgi:hypothetical protein
LGAASQRLILALTASAFLTAAVALPMAYQAREARQDDERDRRPAPVEVLGTSTVRGSETITDTLFVQVTDSEAVTLHGAQVTGAPRISLQAPGVVRADFRLDDGAVQTDTTEPFELDDGAPVALSPGQHSVTVTVTFDDGQSQLHQAFFVATP